MTSTDLADKMPLTQEKRLDSNFANNNDHSYLHKKFKKMATTISVFPPNLPKVGEKNLTPSTCGVSISNGSIAAAHPEIEKIKENQNLEAQNVKKNVQINLSEENCRLSNVNNVVQVSGQTSSTNEFSYKTENLENDFIRDTYNGNVGGRYVCPYCKLSCAKPSVLQKHIRAHTNERPYPCVPCGFAFKTKSNLYKHKRSRTHALRLKGADVPVSINEDDLSGGSESDTSIPPTSISEAGSDSSNIRLEHYESNRYSPESSESMSEGVIPTLTGLSSNETSKFKSLYKPKFRAALYQEHDEKDKLKKSMSPNADFLTEHISKIISDNEAIVDVIDTPLQKKYGKIKQIAESKQLSNETDTKTDLSPLNLTKYNYEMEHNFRKRSHSESLSNIDHHKHPLNPEGSIIKDLLLKSKLNGLNTITELLDGSLFVCPLCQIIFRSADNLETHRMYYCKGNVTNSSINSIKDLKNVRPDNIYVRSNSVNVRLPESQPNTILKTCMSNKSPPLRMKPENLVITKQESNDVAAPLPSPGPLLGHTRLVDTRTSEYNRQKENIKMKPMASPKRRIENRSDTYSPRLAENVSPRLTDLYIQPKIRCIDSSAIRNVDEMSPHLRHNTTSLQMFGGEVKIVDQSGGTTTLRIEPNKNQLSPILIHQNLSPSKLANDPEASSIVVRSGLHSGGTIVHNPPTPKETLATPQPQTPRITMSSVSAATNNSLPNIHDRTHFQFPPLSAITAFNPLTLPPLSPSTSTPNGATTILHGGKLIPHVPGIPGPNTPGIFVNHANSSKHLLSVNNETDNGLISKPVRDDIHNQLIPINIQHMKGSNTSKYESQQLHSSRSSKVIIASSDPEKNKVQDNINSDGQFFVTNLPIIKVKHVDEPNTISQSISKHRQEGSLKRSLDGNMIRSPVLKENMHYAPQKCKREKLSSPLLKTPVPVEIKSERDGRNFNFENLITKAEIFNKLIPSSSDVQKSNFVTENALPVPNERSETFYFQKNVSAKSSADERKPKFLRPSTLPLKPGTFTPKKHHGITPNANTMPLVSPETPRPAKAYGQLYLNGNAYTYLGLKCSTKVFYCTINRPQPTYVPNQHFLSMYSNWQLLSELTPDPLGLSASSAMSLYDSRHRPQNVSVAVLKQDLILTHSSQWNKISMDSKQTIQSTDVKKLEENKYLHSDNLITSKKELTGGFESNEEYTYVRGRGRGRYVCSECGIRCKKPSMLKKHIRTHTDVRPYTCVHCAFSFKTKGNLTKHMKSKAHYKKCCELGINPNEGNDTENGEMTQCFGETDDDSESDGDEGNEGETESSDTEACKSRLPEHEAAHCLLSLGGTRPNTSSTPGLITSARPSTYPYAPTGIDNTAMEVPERVSLSRSISLESRLDADNEPMDLSKNDVKTPTPNVPEIVTARESSVLASLASNTAKLPQHQSQWANGEPMLQTYLTERALLDTKIKQSQLTCNFSKLRKVELESSNYKDSLKSEEKMKTLVTKSISIPISSPQVVTNIKVSPSTDDIEKITTSNCVSKEEVITPPKDPSTSVSSNSDSIRHNVSSSNTENAKYVVSEYLKHARINLIKTHEETVHNTQNHVDNVSEDNTNNINNEENTKTEDINVPESDSMKLPSLDHEPVARKVVIGVGGVAFKVTKGKEFENSSYSPGRLMEDGRRVCDFCNKSFTKPSQLKLHLNIHYMERPFRCGVCAVSFRTRGHLQKHERSGSHHNKVSMTSTFGAATSFNPRPFRCSDCNIAFRIHGHLAKHLRSKMHVMRLECLFKLPFGTFTEIERAGVSLTDIDTTDCASSLASLQTLAKKLHEKDPTKLEYREPMGAGSSIGVKESSDDEEIALGCENISESEKDSEVKTVENIDGQDNDTRVNYSATDI